MSLKKLFGSKIKSEPTNEKVDNEIPLEIKGLISRDKKRNSLFFYNYLNKIIENGKMYEKFKDQYIKEKNDLALKNISRNLSAKIYVYLTPWYSMGKPINSDWQNFYIENIVYYQLCISQDLINGSYKHSLKILSLGVLLEIDKKVFEIISKRFLEESYKDFILDTLLHSQYNDHIISKSLQFPEETYIQKLAEILNSNSKLEAEVLIKDILENYFYTKENLQSSYNTHNTEFYSGYWAWEVAAVVKVMKLNDSSFKDNPYYPYDMVHWNDNNVLLID
ncbi:hypothetical protein B0A58_08760 [Flavobacterium branchiophilum NBRC 15030 = ATCC 35035]|uniref:Uncharacterized protein DUF1910 n=2 Tax=Flavobacterium branchiophilum TaxID=55197 RepID=A0A543G2C8_9FLAO|nr:hypothetical protein B0A58_08760 [Flavobacterium branchiophilum NBRC 15030 = ATCC 35035]TQM40209.1 uncharacterized protein DUF1910 [Flavobacterium branchiophilum]